MKGVVLEEFATISLDYVEYWRIKIHYICDYGRNCEQNSVVYIVYETLTFYQVISLRFE